MASAALLALYGAAGVLEGATALELPDRCPDAEACWKGLRDCRYSSCTIALPWIGADYEQARVLVVGENLNAASELNSLAGDDGYVSDAIRELPIRRRVRFNNPPTVYAGTLLWHCIGAYGAALLRELGVEPFATVGLAEGEVPTSVVIAAYNHLAYLNHVKCSPNNERSRPSSTMWSRCGQRFLAREAEILAPRVVLALGRGNNGRRLARLLAGQWEAIETRAAAAVEVRQFARDGRRLDLVVVPHPSYYAVPWRTVVSALTGCLRVPAPTGRGA